MTQGHKSQLSIHLDYSYYIKTELLVPCNYYTRSRDFQLIGRILVCIFNSSKSYSDMIQYDTICKNTDKRLLDLITRTIGFETKRKYDELDLFVLCSAFKSILKNKGTLAAVEDCVRVLLKAQNIHKPFRVYDVKSEIEGGIKPFKLEILVPDELTDLALLEDMLDYILPAGYIYSIINAGDIRDNIHSDVAGISEIVTQPVTYNNSELGHVLKPTAGNSDEFRTELTTVFREDADNE